MDGSQQASNANSSGDAPAQVNASYQVVARRYRPQVFDQLVGQQHVAQALSNAIATQRIGHAYLFTGARGVGKTSTARIFAKSLNCIEGPTPTPCNHCDICQSIGHGEDVDVLEIDGASNRGIDEIRHLRQNATVRPSRSRYKIYIIDEVHMLTREAFNALLKTLEEPPEHVKFFFCTTEPTKIPITILSRCQRYDFAGIESPQIIDRLRQIAAEEGVTTEDGVLEILARRAAGSMRDAQSLLEQLLSFAPETITLADVHGMLGTADDRRIGNLLAGIHQHQPDVVLRELDQSVQEGVDHGLLIEQLMGSFRDMMVLASGGAPQLVLFSSSSEIETLRSAADTLGIHTILAALQILEQTHTRMRYSTQPRILNELALVRICHLHQLEDLGQLIARLQSAENSPPAPAVPSAAKKKISQGISHTESGPPAERATESLSPQDKQENTSNSSPPPSPKKTAPPSQPAKESSPAIEEEDPAVSTNSQPSTPLQLDDHEAMRLWKSVSANMTGMATTQIAHAERVSFSPPHTMVLYYDEANFKMVQGLCRNQENVQRFTDALREKTGHTLVLKCKCLEKPPGQGPEEAARRKIHRAPPFQKQQLLLETSEHPLVQKAEKVFGANLEEVDNPPNSP